MATHVLPTAYQMNTTSTNVGGWGASQLRKDMNFVDGTAGAIYTKFSSDFVSQVKSVSKKYCTGNATTSTSSGNYKFWILSNSELGGSGAPISEGSQYAWCSKTGTTYSASSNTALANWKTRAGATPGSAYNAYANWWTRSPFASYAYRFSYVCSDGYIGNNYDYIYDSASKYWGIVPAFCF